MYMCMLSCRVADVSRTCRGRVADVSRACRGRVAGVSWTWAARVLHGSGDAEPLERCRALLHRQSVPLPPRREPRVLLERSDGERAGGGSLRSDGLAGVHSRKVLLEAKRREGVSSERSAALLVVAATECAAERAAPAALHLAVAPCKRQRQGDAAYAAADDCYVDRLVTRSHCIVRKPGINRRRKREAACNRRKRQRT